MMSRQHRSGAVLLEVMVALAILASVASSAAWRASEWVRTVHVTHAREAEASRADRLLTAVYLWPRADLERHLGATPQGPWRLHVERAGDDLYEVLITDTASGAPVVGTAVYRHDQGDQ